MFRRVSNNKGITLVEMLIVFALLTIIISLGVNFFLFGNQVFVRGSSQYNVQSSVRLAATGVTDSVRFATSMDVESVAPNTFEDPFNYVYLDNGSVVLNYVDQVGNRTSRILGSGITSLEFSNQSNRLINMSISGLEGDQEFDIDMEIGLPNMELQNKDITGTNGLALKFYSDLAISTPGGSGEVNLNRETNFTLNEGETAPLIANREVTWSITSGTGISISSTGVQSINVTATGSIGDSATIRATSVEDSSKWREVTVTIVEEIYSVDIVKENGDPITGPINLVVGSSEILRALVTPNPDDDENIEIIQVYWYGPISGADDAFFKYEPDADDESLVIVTGEDPSGQANLSVEVVLSDGTTLSNSVLISVTGTTQYAKLLDISFSSGTFSPVFNSDHLTYTISGAGNSVLNINTPQNTTFTLSPTYDNSNQKSYNLNNHRTISITVSEPGKINRVYQVTIQ